MLHHNAACWDPDDYQIDDAGGTRDCPFLVLKKAMDLSLVGDALAVKTHLVDFFIDWKKKR